MELGGGGAGALPVSDCQQLSTALYHRGGVAGLPDGGDAGPSRPSAGLGSTCTKAGTAPSETQKGMTFVLAGQVFLICPFGDQLPSRAHNLEILLWPSL